MIINIDTSSKQSFSSPPPFSPLYLYFFFSLNLSPPPSLPSLFLLSSYGRQNNYSMMYFIKYNNTIVRHYHSTLQCHTEHFNTHRIMYEDTNLVILTMYVYCIISIRSTSYLVLMVCGCIVVRSDGVWMHSREIRWCVDVQS